MKKWDVYDFMLFFQSFNLLQENFDELDKSIDVPLPSALPSEGSTAHSRFLN